MAKSNLVSNLADRVLWREEMPKVWDYSTKVWLVG